MSNHLMESHRGGARGSKCNACRGLPWTPFITVVCWAIVVGWFRLGGSDDPGVPNVMTLIATTLAVIVLLAWCTFFARLPRRIRFLPLAAAVVFLAVFVSLFELGFTGDMRLDPRFRWGKPVLPVAEADIADVVPPGAADFPQFLGPHRNGVVDGVRLEHDWRKHPPKQLWRHPIGEGWSSFAVVGSCAVTQEQRDAHEAVVCYDLATGKVRWMHTDREPVRFVDGFRLGGVGPRATPTIHQGKVYALGATGVLNCLRLADGRLQWTKDILTDNDAINVMWGKSGSPLVVDDKVIVSAGGTDGKSLVAYHVDSGRKIWSGGESVSSYSSPGLATIAGVRQVLIVNEDNLTAHDPADGRVLWQFEWLGKSDSKANASQAVDVGGDRVLLTKGYGGGGALIKVVRDARGDWAVEEPELWRSERVLRTKFSNVVIRNGYVYGFHETKLQCVRLDTGQPQWTSDRRFGYGQLILVDDLLVAMSETDGDVALVEATPDGFHQVAHYPVLEGRTWNGPALAGRYLLVRNYREAACYELPTDAE